MAETTVVRGKADKAVRSRQQHDAQRLLERLQQVDTPDLKISYALHKSSVVLPGILVRFLALAVLFRLNSPKKWRLALQKNLLPEEVRCWLGIGDLADPCRAGDRRLDSGQAVCGYAQLAGHRVPGPLASDHAASG